MKTNHKSAFRAPVFDLEAEPSSIDIEQSLANYISLFFILRTIDDYLIHLAVATQAR